MKKLTLTILAALGVSACAQSPSLQVPSGFKVNVFADGFGQPRHLALAPNGDVFISDPGRGEIVVLTDANRDGKAEGRTVFASGLNRPYSIEFHKNWVYVGNTDAVVRFPYKSGDRKATGPAEKLIDLPEGGHWTRTATFGPDGRLYVSVGSTCNVCEENDPRRAAIWVYDENGKNGKVYATGLRNAVGLAWFNNQLYATNNGRDQLGDNLPPEGFYKVKEGGFYGWPYCYTTQAGQPQVWDRDFGRKTADTCKNATPAFSLVTAHSAPLGLAFYTGNTFPAAYKGQMFVALHGSWNRSQKSGYKVVMVSPQTGKVTDFMTGFLKGQTTLGRPVALAVAADGSLLLSDDGAGKVWRVQYGK